MNAQYIIDILVNNGQMRGKLREVQNSLKETAQVTAAARKGFRVFGTEVNWARQMVYRFLSVTAGLYIIRNILGVWRGFAEEMAIVKAISGATTQQFKELTMEARRLGATTRFTATQAASGLVFLARAGFDADQQLITLESTLRLAQAGNIALARAADISTNVLTAFGLRAEQLVGVVDSMALVTNRSNTNMLQLGNAMKLVAPIASALNVDVNTTLAMVGTIANVGLQGTRGGTGIRALLTRIEEPTSRAKTAIDELGLTIDQLKISEHGPIEVLETLFKAGTTLGQGARIVGIEAASAFNAMMNNLPILKSLYRTLEEEATGSASRIAKTMDEQINAAFKALTSAYQEFLIATGDAGPIYWLEGAVRGVTEAIRWANANFTIFVNIFETLMYLIGSRIFFRGFSFLVRIIRNITGSRDDLKATFAIVKFLLAGSNKWSKFGLIGYTIGLAFTGAAAALASFSDEMLRSENQTISRFGASLIAVGRVVKEDIGGSFDYLADKLADPKLAPFWKIVVSQAGGLLGAGIGSLLFGAGAIPGYAVGALGTAALVNNVENFSPEGLAEAGTGIIEQFEIGRAQMHTFNTLMEGLIGKVLMETTNWVIRNTSGRGEPEHYRTADEVQREWQANRIGWARPGYIFRSGLSRNPFDTGYNTTIQSALGVITSERRRQAITGRPGEPTPLRTFSRQLLDDIAGESPPPMFFSGLSRNAYDTGANRSIPWANNILTSSRRQSAVTGRPAIRSAAVTLAESIIDGISTNTAKVLKAGLSRNAFETAFNPMLRWAQGVRTSEERQAIVSGRPVQQNQLANRLLGTLIPHRYTSGLSVNAFASRGIVARTSDQAKRSAGIIPRAPTGVESELQGYWSMLVEKARQSGEDYLKRPGGFEAKREEALNEEHTRRMHLIFGMLDSHLRKARGASLRRKEHRDLLAAQRQYVYERSLNDPEYDAFITKILQGARAEIDSAQLGEFTLKTQVRLAKQLEEAKRKGLHLSMQEYYLQQDIARSTEIQLRNINARKESTAFARQEAFGLKQRYQLLGLPKNMQGIMQNEQRIRNRWQQGGWRERYPGQMSNQILASEQYLVDKGFDDVRLTLEDQAFNLALRTEQLKIPGGRKYNDQRSALAIKQAYDTELRKIPGGEEYLSLDQRAALWQSVSEQESTKRYHKTLEQIENRRQLDQQYLKDLTYRQMDFAKSPRDRALDDRVREVAARYAENETPLTSAETRMIRDAEDMLDFYEGIFSSLAETAKGTFESVAGYLSDLWIKGESDFDEFKKNILKGLFEMAVQKTFIDPAANLFDGFVRSMFGPSFAGPHDDKLADSLGAGVGGNSFWTNLFPGKERGGPASGLTWVGEGGRELVDLPPGSHVYSNSQSRKMMGTTINNEIHISADSSTTQAMIDSSFETAKEAIKEETINSLSALNLYDPSRSPVNA